MIERSMTNAAAQHQSIREEVQEEQDLSVDPTIARHVQVVVKKYEESKAPTYPVPIYLPKHPPELHLREWGRIEREWARQAHLRHDGKRNKAPKLTSFYSIVMLLLGVVRFLRTRMRFITQRQKDKEKMAMMALEAERLTTFHARRLSHKGRLHVPCRVPQAPPKSGARRSDAMAVFSRSHHVKHSLIGGMTKARQEKVSSNLLSGSVTKLDGKDNDTSNDWTENANRRRLTQDITVSSKRYQRLKGGSAQTNTSSIIQSPYHTPPKQQLHPSLTLSFSFEGSTRFTSLNFPVQADSDIPAPGLFDILHPIPPSDPPQTASTRRLGTSQNTFVERAACVDLSHNVFVVPGGADGSPPLTADSIMPPPSGRLFTADTTTSGTHAHSNRGSSPSPPVTRRPESPMDTSRQVSFVQPSELALRGIHTPNSGATTLAPASPIPMAPAAHAIAESMPTQSLDFKHLTMQNTQGLAALLTYRQGVAKAELRGLAQPTKGLMEPYARFRDFKNNLLIDRMQFNRRVHSELKRARAVRDGLFKEKQNQILAADTRLAWATNVRRSKRGLVEYLGGVLDVQSKTATMRCFQDLAAQAMGGGSAAKALLDRLEPSFREQTLAQANFEAVVAATPTPELFDQDVQLVLQKAAPVFDVTPTRLMDLLSARHVHYRLKDEPKKGLDDDDHSWLMDEKSPTLKRGDTGIRRPNKKRSVSEAIAEKIARYTQAQQDRGVRKPRTSDALLTPAYQAPIGRIRSPHLAAGAAHAQNPLNTSRNGSDASYTAPSPMTPTPRQPTPQRHNSGTKISLMVPTTPTMSPQPALEMSVTAASP